MSGRKIILANGAEIEGECGYTGSLWCYTTSKSMASVSALFCDENNTKKIVFIYGEMQDVFTGFTEVIKIARDERGMIYVQLSGANTTYESGLPTEQREGE